MHREDQWAMGAGDRAGDARAVFVRHEQVRREAVLLQACQGDQAPGPRSLAGWVHQLRSGADSAEGALGSGEARAPRRPLRTLIDRLQRVVVPGRAAHV